jgi:F-box protein 9
MTHKLDSFRVVDQAMNDFILASQYEKAGNLSDAIQLYKSGILSWILVALRTDPNVEQRYQEFIPIPPIHVNLPILELGHELTRLQVDTFVNSTFNLLPIEGFICIYLLVVVHIVEWSIYHDIINLSKLSRTCIKMNSITKQSCIWKFISVKLHRDSLLESQLSLYQSNWFLLYLHSSSFRFLQKPLLRRDGVFISRINYTRQGQSDCSFYQPIHVVTYYRYIRFTSYDSFIFLTTSNEPSMVVKADFYSIW